MSGEQYIQIPCDSAVNMDGEEHQCNKAKGHIGDHCDYCTSDEGVDIEVTWCEEQS